MTDDQHGDRHGQDAPRGGGRWDPLPQGEYDDGATAFVQLPEGGIDALLSGDSPLAAPGQYVPPQIQANTPHEGAPAPGDTGTGAWAAPAGGVQWPEPGPPTSGGDRFTYHPGATGQWTFDDGAANTADAVGVPEPAPGPGHDVTGQWSIPVAGGDLPDESGEFTTSSLVEQWGGGSPPATLPGGASAPWATGPADPGAGDPHGGDTPGGETHGGDAWGRQPGDGDTYGGRGFDPHGGQGHDPHGAGVPSGYAGGVHPDDAGQQGAHPASHGTPDAPGDARHDAHHAHDAHDAEPSYDHSPVEGVQPLSEAPASHDGTGDAPGPREAADAAHRAAATDGDTPGPEDDDTGPDATGSQDAPADGTDVTDAAVAPDGREQDDAPPPQAPHEEHPSRRTCCASTAPTAPSRTRGSASRCCTCCASDSGWRAPRTAARRASAGRAACRSTVGSSPPAWSRPSPPPAARSAPSRAWPSTGSRRTCSGRSPGAVRCSAASACRAWR